MFKKVSIKGLTADNRRVLYKHLFDNFVQGVDYELTQKHLSVFNKKVLEDTLVRKFVIEQNL